MILALKAHTNGSLNYENMNFDSITDIIKERLILSSLEEDIYIDTVESFIRREFALMSVYDGDGRKKSYEKSSELLSDISRRRLPWILKDSGKMNKNDIVVELQSRWESVFGKLDTPEMQAKLLNIKKAMAIKTTEYDGIRWQYKR